MTLPQSEVRFIEDGHSYFLGMDELVGVTTILRKVLFPAQYEGIDADVLQRAAERGTAIHNTIQAFERGEQADTDGYDCAYALEQWRKQRPKDLTFVADEYLVSDNEKVASKIDIVFADTDNDYVLVDMKSTSECDKAYLSWQLSFYAWMFEMQTGHKVKSIIGAWWDKANWHFFGVGRKRDADIVKVRDAYFGDAVERIAAIEQVNTLPQPLMELGKMYAHICEAYKSAEANKKDVEARTLDAMREYGVESFETPDVKVTRIASTTSKGFDVDAFKAQYPDMYKMFLTKETARKESIRITLRKKD